MQNMFVVRNIQHIKNQFKQQQKRQKPIWANQIARLELMKKMVQYHSQVRGGSLLRPGVSHMQLQRQRTFDFGLITNSFNLPGRGNTQNPFKFVTEDNDSMHEQDNMLDDGDEHALADVQLNLQIPLACQRIVHRDIAYTQSTSGQQTPEAQDTPHNNFPFSTLRRTQPNSYQDPFSPQFLVQSIHRLYDFTPAVKQSAITSHSPFFLKDEAVTAFEKPPKAPKRQ